VSAAEGQIDVTIDHWPDLPPAISDAISPSAELRPKPIKIANPGHRTLRNRLDLKAMPSITSPLLAAAGHVSF
jgi:hypothetical protein